MLTTDKILQGRYRIVRQLGHGGMGAVYEAQDKKRFNALVALKEILFDLNGITDSKQHEMLERAFEREAKILAEVQHEVFPHVIEYFSENDHQYLVMELIQGADLAELLSEQKTPFPLDEILQWTDQLLDALDYLHSFNPPIYHRDLKPQNLKLTARGKIKLLDFGIAKSAEANLTATITNQTFIAATLNYSPFEQILRVIDPTLREVITQKYEDKINRILEQNADARSDLYALGATLYHLSTAFVPTDALKRTLEVWADKPDPLRPPHKLNPDIPEEISLIFLKALEIDRENRFASAVEMRESLNETIVKLRRREREAAKKREEEIQRAKWLAEQEKLEQERLERERQIAEQERLRFEAERKQQAEQIQLKLRENEEQRQIIEKESLRIETERKRLENEHQSLEQELLRVEASLAELRPQEAKTYRLITGQNIFETQQQQSPPEESNAAKSAAATVQFGSEFTQQSYLADISLEPEKPEIAFTEALPAPEASSEPEEQADSPDVSPAVTGSLPFTLSHKPKPALMLPIAILIVFMLGGVALGIWLLQSLNTAEPSQLNSVQTTYAANDATPEATIEATPETVAEATPETSVQQESKTEAAIQPLTPETIAAPVSREPVKVKPPETPRVEKPAPKPTKTPKENKPLKIEDILKDN